MEKEHTLLQEDMLRWQDQALNKEEIIKGIEHIINIAMQHCHPNMPNSKDWYTVYSIADIIHNDLTTYKNNENTHNN